MKTVFQTDEYGCGAACLAMLAGISYAKARMHLFGKEGPTSSGICKGPLLQALEELGLQVGERGRIKSGSLAELRHDALVYGKLLPTRGQIDAGATEGHWLVWDAKERVIRDPYKYKKPCWLTSFTIVSK